MEWILFISNNKTDELISFEWDEIKWICRGKNKIIQKEKINNNLFFYYYWKFGFGWDYFRRNIDLIRSPIEAGASLIERRPPDLEALSDLKNRFEPKEM
jgi:hypothetical protein